MMQFSCGQAKSRLPVTLMILGMALLVAACSSDGGDEGVKVEVPADGNGMPGDNGGPMMTELGEWNTLMPGGDLDISDANSVLRAHYESGVGHVDAPAPVQPAGTGTATWTGNWSGKVANTDGWMSYGVTREELQVLGGEALITVHFEAAGVETELTYRGIGLGDSIGLEELTFDRVSVIGGMFEPEVEYEYVYISNQGGVEVTVTGDFTGEGAFGGTDAEGVVGHVGGPLSLNYGQGPRGLGTLQSVFYGTNDDN